MTHLRSLVAVSFACTLAWGCDVHSIPSRPSDTNTIRGSGRVVTESRAVAGFSAITVSSAARLVIVHSDVESLSVTAEDNILPLVRTEVVGGRLVLELAPGASVSLTRQIVFQVSARTLSAIDASGAVVVEAGGLDTDVLSIHVLGASQVTASGAARELRVDLSGSSRCQLEGVAARTAVATASGTSVARLRVADSLAATVTGLSIVEYYGDPQVVANVSGAGAVRRVGP
jgi:hypothetical protein